MNTWSQDTDLLTAFQQGAPWAEREVFDRLFRPLAFYAQSMVTSRDIAEDIAVVALTKGIERRADFRGLRQFASFCYRSVYNACINHGIAEKRHRKAHQQIAYTSEGTGNLDNEMLWAEALEEIYKEVENLPDRCGTIFRLLFFEGLSTDEIGRRLDINPQTVRSQKTRAIGLIRTALLKKGRLTALALLYAWLQWPS